MSASPPPPKRQRKCNAIPKVEYNGDDVQSASYIPEIKQESNGDEVQPVQPAAKFKKGDQVHVTEIAAHKATKFIVKAAVLENGGWKYALHAPFLGEDCNITISESRVFRVTYKLGERLAFKVSKDMIGAGRHMGEAQLIVQDWRYTDGKLTYQAKVGPISERFWCSRRLDIGAFESVPVNIRTNHQEYSQQLSPPISANHSRRARGDSRHTRAPVAALDQRSDHQSFSDW